MSDTPRTDREVYTVTERDIGYKVVNPALCRQLERELRAAQERGEAVVNKDRQMLEYLMGQFDGEVFYCPCGRSEPTKDCDSAQALRDYLAENPAPAAPVDEQTEREAFEAWMDAGAQQYVNQDIREWMLMAWQAALAQRRGG